MLGGRQLHISSLPPTVCCFIQRRVLGTFWCLGKDSQFSSLTHLGTTFVWELRIYSAGSNCLHQGPEATSEGLTQQSSLKEVQNLEERNTFASLDTLLYGFENGYNFLVRGSPEQAIYSDFSTMATVPQQLSSQVLNLNVNTLLCVSCIGRESTCREECLDPNSLKMQSTTYLFH